MGAENSTVSEEVVELPSFKDVESAMSVLKSHAVKTPLVRCDKLSIQLSANVFIKAESMQKVGAFKFRGAFNRISRLTDEEKSKGVVAYSSGNHAQAVAYSAQLLGMKSVIVMPKDAPKMKIENTKGYGAEVILYDRVTESRVAISEQIMEERGSILVRPFEDFHVIAGQGTAGLEAQLQLKEHIKRVNGNHAKEGFESDTWEEKDPQKESKETKGKEDKEDQTVEGQQSKQEENDKEDDYFDIFVIPISGGGLAAGCSIALKHLSPKTVIIGVEPEGFNDTQRSLQSGSIETNEQKTGSICDALLSPSPGQTTFKILKQNITEVVTVTDTEVLQAIKYAWEHAKLVGEPGGVTALAALLSGKLAHYLKPEEGDGEGCRRRPLNIGLLLSGGNVDTDVFTKALSIEA